jgi:hypothetical protein
MDARELPLHPNPQHYRKLAKELVKICKSGNPGTIHQEGTTVTVTPEQLLRRHPRLAKLSESELQSAKFTLTDAQFIIAREYGFKSWSKFTKHIESLLQKDSPVSTFESAADAIISGDLTTLKLLLREQPQLVRERSTRVHRATLLHYISANGVEDFRQKTPENAVKVAETLLNAGATVDALAETYGGGSAQTTLCLLVSSVHPAKAGVQAALVETLADFGAAVNGLENDGLPLMTALAFWYIEAAEALIRRGARVDNIVVAAALGQLEKVKSFINEDGSLKANLPPVIDPWGGWISKDRQMGQAFIHACLSGQTEVVDFLLEKRVDPSAGANTAQTGFHYAAHVGHLEIVKLLIARNVPMEMKNMYGGTVLGQTVWSALNEPKADHIPIIEALLTAGADIEAAGYPTGNQRLDEVLQRYSTKSGVTD